MCGRFTLTASALQIKEHFRLQQASAVLIPRYNIAPSQIVVIIKNNSLDFATWGFKMSNSINSIINAKIETVLEKQCFNMAFKKQRCLIVASGFFEWKTIGNKKAPFYIQVKDHIIIGLAGIFIKDSCAILTTKVDQTKYKNAIHDRIPVIINKSNYHLWLNQKTSIDVLRQSDLQINQEDFLMYPVSSQVNSPKFDNAVCIRSLDYTEQT